LNYEKAKGEKMRKRSNQITLCIILFMIGSIFLTAETKSEKNDDSRMSITIDCLHIENFCVKDYRIKEGGTIVVKIINKNPFIWDATIQGESIEYFGSPTNLTPPTTPPTVKIQAKLGQPDIQPIIERFFKNIKGIRSFYSSLRNTVIQERAYDDINNAIINLEKNDLLEDGNLPDDRITLDQKVITKLCEILAGIKSDFYALMTNITDDSSKQIIKDDYEDVIKNDYIGKIIDILNKCQEDSFCIAKLFPDIQGDEFRIYIKI
jgi:hypothetical protein